MELGIGYPAKPKDAKSLLRTGLLRSRAIVPALGSTASLSSKGDAMVQSSGGELRRCDLEVPMMTVHPRVKATRSSAFWNRTIADIRRATFPSLNVLQKF